MKRGFLLNEHNGKTIGRDRRLNVNGSNYNLLLSKKITRIPTYILYYNQTTTLVWLKPLRSCARLAKARKCIFSARRVLAPGRHFIVFIFPGILASATTRQWLRHPQSNGGRKRTDLVRRRSASDQAHVRGYEATWRRQPSSESRVQGLRRS